MAQSVGVPDEVPACRLTSLRTLSLQSNRLTSMVGFGRCIHLEELYLSHNGISRLEVCTSVPGKVYQSSKRTPLPARHDQPLMCFVTCL